jgi:hypothetical protein
MADMIKVPLKIYQKKERESEPVSGKKHDPLLKKMDRYFFHLDVTKCMVRNNHLLSNITNQDRKGNLAHN